MSETVTLEIGTKGKKGVSQVPLTAEDETS
jgi:hypothetical protein